MTSALLALSPGELTLMPWVRMDDLYPTHRKVAGLSDAAFRLHTAAIFWCRRNKTDGFVADEDLDQVCAQVRDPARFAAECVKRRTWHRADHACASETCPGPRDEPGWVIHDYLDYQPTAEETEVAQKKQAEKKSEGGKLGNHRRWHDGPDGKPNPDCPWCPSLSDRYPIGPSDRLPIAPSRPIPSSVVSVVSQISRRYARVLDDDDFLKSVIGRIHARHGRVLLAAEVRIMAAAILERGGDVRDPGAYVLRSIENEPDPIARWLPNAVASEPPPPLPAEDGHPFKPDGYGMCEVCELPESNRRHLEAS